MTDQTPPANEAAARRRALQARAFTLTWLGYASYYLTRKNFSVVKNRLHEELGISVGALAGIDTFYLVLYAVGQFLCGGLGDRFGARRMLAFGMFASAAGAVVFGLSSTWWILALAFGLNGVFQATGWPNSVKAMTPWLARRSRGFVMGIWCTNYQVGGLAATALATFALVNFGWRAAFFAPAGWVGAVGLIVLLFLIDKPQDAGLPPLDDNVDVAFAAGPAAPRRSPFMAMIRLPALWILGGSYFGLKLIRYSLLFWLPFFLKRSLGYSEGAAGYLSTSFEAGGIVGVVLIGRVADRWFAKNPMRLVAPVILALAGSFLMLRVAGPIGMWAVGGSLALIGFLLFGPDALLSGAVAQNLGRDRAAGSAAGIINGLGSIGGACQGVVTAYVSQTWGWNALFLFFVAFAVVSAFALLPLAWRREF